MKQRCHAKWYANQLLVEFCDDKVVFWTAYDDPGCEGEPSCFYAVLRWDEGLELAKDLIDWLREVKEREQG